MQRLKKSGWSMYMSCHTFPHTVMLKCADIVFLKNFALKDEHDNKMEVVCPGLS